MTEEDSNMDSESNTKYKDGVNRNARLIVRNVSFKATEENLKEYFSQYGNVEEVKLLKKPDGRLVGCAFVHYTHVPMANKALAATNKKPFLGRPIYVAWAVPQNKYSENVQGNGPKKKFDSTSDDTKIEVKDEDTESKLSKYDKDKIRINRKARLIVRNISFKATEESLREHFEPYGIVQEVKLLKKPDGKLVGCAFVHFKNVPMATKAILNTNLKPFLGRPISVDWAVAKDQYMRHVVNKQTEMQDAVKKEDSSDDEDDNPMNISNDSLKQEIKSESDESSDNDEKDDDEVDEEEDDDDDEEKDDDDDDEEDSEDGVDDEDNENEDDDKSVTSTQPDFQRKKLNDAEDGCTVFLTNIPFSIDNDQLNAFAEKTGPVKYALVCVDKLTEHSKGSGFIKFVNKDDADRFLALPADELRLDGQVMQVRPALKKENLQTGNKKQPKDNRNLYLVKEGVIVAGTKAAVGVSASDMSKRLALERSKTQMLKNLNRFVSRYRLVVSNLPANYDDAALRRVCARAAPRAVVTEARVMRDLRAGLQRDGKHPSKGYGFVMFTRHEDALACLRKLNNNPDIFDKNNRPIVSFSIEDRTALNARKKRLEKSIANNPLAKKDDESNENKRRNRKRKNTFTPDESYMKKGRFENKNNQNTKNNWNNQNNQNNTNNQNKQNNRQNRFNKNKRNNQNSNQNGEVGRFVKKPKQDSEEYTGLTAKEGSQHKMRTGHKLRAQADIHRQNVKLEKKKSKRAMRLKMAARERIKQPKQKINKSKTGKRNKKRKFNDEII